MKDDRIIRYRWIVIAGLFFVGLFQVGRVDAKLFGRFRERRGGGDGNVTNNAPIAPANLDGGPGMPTLCGPNGCPQPIMPQLQTQIAIPTYAYPAATIPTQTSIVTTRLVPVPSNSLLDSDRVDRILAVVESKLGLTAQNEVAGDNTLFRKLPVVHVELRTQDGEVTDSTDFDLRAFILRKLSE